MVAVEELGLEIAELAARLDAATHRLLECIRQFDEANAWAEQGAVSWAHWLSWRIGLDLGTAREKVRVARALGQLPAIDQAFAAGKLSYAKVRAITRVATPAKEAALLDLALAATGAQLEKICRGYRAAVVADQPPSAESRSVRRRELAGGMVKLELVLCPDEADLVLRAVDRAREVEARDCDDGHQDVSAEERDANSAWPSRPDGVVAMAAGFLAGNTGKSNGADRYQVMVHVGQDPLAPDGQVAATLEDGTRVSAESFRRIACDCALVPIAENGALSLGRKTRAISPLIRRALHLRDHGCRFPGCSHDRFLHGHHIQHWLHGGETSMSNLLQLCSHHHHLVHEGGWTIEKDDSGDWQFIAPNGKAVASEATQAWTGDIMTWLREWADERGVDLGPDANEPLWDGTRPDYDAAVAGLCGGG